ncbi:MAG: metal ABC transporter ATP-binding protein [Thermoprotei archaeon]|nr:metal ABC transporter ATP-binding protein [Thermoprotei archaeon]
MSSVRQHANTINVRVESVHVYYGPVKALEDVSLELGGPGIVQVLGPNGAGKSTLFKVIAGIIRPSLGRVYINGVEVTGNPGVTGRFVAYMPQSNEPPKWSTLTVWEYVETAASIKTLKWPRLRPLKVRDVVEKCLNTVGLPKSLWGVRLSELSGGSYQRAILARTLIGGASAILLDEPLASVDPEGRVSLAEILASLAREKLIVVSSHDPHPLLEYTKLVILLNRRLIAMGDADSVLRAYTPQALYPRWVAEHGH